MKQTKTSIDLSLDILRSIRLELYGNMASITATQAWGNSNSSAELGGAITLFVEECETRKKSVALLGRCLVSLGKNVIELAKGMTE